MVSVCAYLAMHCMLQYLLCFICVIQRSLARFLNMQHSFELIESRTPMLFVNRGYYSLWFAGKSAGTDRVKLSG